jgi:protein-S-isoprenylcysteine O-methyltransferase Ste14
MRLPALGPRGEGWVAMQVVLIGVVLLAGLLGPAWTGTARLVTTILGMALAVGGAVLARRGLADLAGALTPLPRPLEGAQLVDSGAYALVRHPIYGGVVLASAGYALLVASVPALVASVVLVAFFRLKSAREELWLAERYPGYGDYQRRTRRFIPYVY